jgi:hypothetical protein
MPRTIVTGPGKTLELPGSFTQYRQLSPLGNALTAIQNDQRQVSAFAWTHRQEISQARSRAISDISASGYVIWGSASKPYYVHKAMSSILGVTRSQVAVLESSLKMSLDNSPSRAGLSAAEPTARGALG